MLDWYFTFQMFYFFFVVTYDFIYHYDTQTMDVCNDRKPKNKTICKRENCARDWHNKKIIAKIYVTRLFWIFLLINSNVPCCRVDHTCTELCACLIQFTFTKDWKWTMLTHFKDFSIHVQNVVIHLLIYSNMCIHVIYKVQLCTCFNFRTFVSGRH